MVLCIFRWKSRSVCITKDFLFNVLYSKQLFHISMFCIREVSSVHWAWSCMYNVKERIFLQNITYFLNYTSLTMKILFGKTWLEGIYFYSNNMTDFDAYCLYSFEKSTITLFLYDIWKKINIYTVIYRI